MNISLLEPLNVPKPALEALAAPLRAAGHCFTAWPDKAKSPEEMLRRVAGQDIVIIANTPFPESVVRGTDSLRLLVVAFTGVDHVAMTTCRERGVTVCNCANYSNQSVAEMTVGLALSLLRRLPEGDEALRQGRSSAGLTGGEICGRTVGVIGTGRIGGQVIRLFQAFGARILAYSRTPKKELESLGVAYVSLDELLKQSDIVTLHVPATAETKGLIGKRELALMKPDALLINCARGPVVDAAALAEALRAGRLAGAGVDVFDQEPPLPQDHPLLNAPHVVLTPHVAYLTQEAMARRAKIAFDNVAAYLRGAPQNICE